MNIKIKRLVKLSAIFSLIAPLLVLRYGVDVSSRGWITDFLVFAVPAYVAFFFIIALSNLPSTRMKSSARRVLSTIGTTIVLVVVTTLTLLAMSPGASHGGIVLLIVVPAIATIFSLVINVLVNFLLHRETNEKTKK